MTAAIASCQEQLFVLRYAVEVLSLVVRLLHDAPDSTVLVLVFVTAA